MNFLSRNSPDADEVDDGIDFGHHRLKLFKAGGLHSGSLLFRQIDRSFP